MAVLDFLGLAVVLELGLFAAGVYLLWEVREEQRELRAMLEARLPADGRDD